jgi:hypothetical protein
MQPWREPAIVPICGISRNAQTGKVELELPNPQTLFERG